MNWTGGARTRAVLPSATHGKPKNIIESCEFKLPWAKREQEKLKQDSKMESIISIQSIHTVEDDVQIVKDIHDTEAVDTASISEIKTQASSEDSAKSNTPKHFLDLCGSPDIEKQTIKKRKNLIPDKPHVQLHQYVVKPPKSFQSDCNDSLFKYLDTPQKSKPHSQQVSPDSSKESDDVLQHNKFNELQEKMVEMESFLRSKFPEYPALQ